MRVLAVGFDLFFRPRLTAAAQQVDAEVVATNNPKEAAALAPDVDRVVADASTPGALDVLQAVRDANPTVPMVACYPHVQADVAEAARKLGAETPTRGQFNNDLAGWIRG